MIFIGIDPGLRSGAWGAIDHHGGFVACGDIVSADDRLDAKALKGSLLSVITAGDVAEICIELVGPMPGQGIASTGKFLRAAGCIDAVCSLMDCPLSYVTPKEWKKHFGLTSNKDDSLTAARRLFPEAVPHLKRVRDHGRAEALMMAEYARHQAGFMSSVECGR